MTDLSTMTWDKWQAMSEAEREAARDYSDLSPQLSGLERCRVEVVDNDGATRRFIVGRSTGWRPCHLEIARRNSSGGFQASKQYRSVRVLERNVR